MLDPSPVGLFAFASRLLTKLGEWAESALHASPHLLPDWYDDFGCQAAFVRLVLEAGAFSALLLLLPPQVPRLYLA